MVVAGGAVGAVARVAIAARFAADAGAVPWSTFVTNVSGAFVLGVVLTLLVDRPGVPSEVRLAICTGALGAFTTYSTLAWEIVDRLSAGHVVLGTGYALGTVFAGVAAAASGVALARWLRRTPRSGPR